MKTHLLAPVLAAFAMFVFGAIFWMCPFAYKVLSTTPDDRATLAALDALFPATGIYVVPSPTSDPETVAKLFETGPSAMIHFMKEGHPMMDPAMFVQGYLHYFAVAFFLGIILRKVPGSCDSYCSAVKLCTLIGFAGCLLLSLNEPIWWRHLWSWGLISLLYGTLTFTVAGLVLAKFLPKKVPAA